MNTPVRQILSLAPPLHFSLLHVELGEFSGRWLHRLELALLLLSAVEGSLRDLRDPEQGESAPSRRDTAALEARGPGAGIFN